MHRFMVYPQNINNDCIIIEGEDLKHLSQVLRLKEGDLISVFDGNGTEYQARLTSIHRKYAEAKIISSFISQTEPRIHLTLFQGLPKGHKMDFIVQKAVELGIYKIIPVITERTVIKLNNKDRIKKTERWRKIAIEAAKQCGRAYVPEVCAPVSFDEALLKRDEFDAFILLYENEQKKCLKELLKCYNINKIRNLAIFIGSEGGFSDREVEKCVHSCYDVAGLGKRILRTETASISVISIIMYEMGELQ
jgi:16S rRNA (uracil1498-N3)-methyltransferase